jgi:PmbA protein
LKSVEQSESRGGALRLVAGGKLGFATTTDFSDPGRWIQAGLESARYGDPFAVEFSEPAELKSLDTVDPRLKALSLEEMISMGQAVVEKMREFNPKILTYFSIGRQFQTIAIANSSGFEKSFERTLFHCALGGNLTEGKNFLECYDGISQLHFDFDLEAYVSSIIESFRHGQKNVPAKSGPATVVLTPRAVSGILLALELGLSGKSVAKKTSPLIGKLQRSLLDERVTLYDDGTLKGASNTAPFDDEGTPTRRTPVIERGMLKNYLLDLQSADELGMNPTGNGYRLSRLYNSKEYTELPGPGVSSWVMKGGERQFDEIVDSLDDAILVDQMMGLHMSTHLSGDFAGNIALGYKIEKGKIAGRVKDCVFSGNFYELFGPKHLVEISQDQRWIGGAHGGTHLLPTVVLKNASLATKN